MCIRDRYSFDSMSEKSVAIAINGIIIEMPTVSIMEIIIEKPNKKSKNSLSLLVRIERSFCINDYPLNTI